jgi:hypothetical protein
MAEVKEKVKKVELDASKEYVFVSNGKSKHLPKGSEYKITGEMAIQFVKQGLGEVK